MLDALPPLDSSSSVASSLLSIAAMTMLRPAAASPDDCVASRRYLAPGDVIALSWFTLRVKLEASFYRSRLISPPDFDRVSTMAAESLISVTRSDTGDDIVRLSGDEDDRTESSNSYRTYASIRTWETEHD